VRADGPTLAGYRSADDPVLDSPYILIHERRISSMNDLLPVLEFVARRPSAAHHRGGHGGRGAGQLSSDKLQGTLQVAAVKAPGYGDRRKAMLEDVAILTNGRAVTEDLGISLY
jgi:chaperonin GroEL